MTAISFSGPYHKRQLRFLDLAYHRDWTVKVYTITTTDLPISSSILDAAKRLAFSHLDKWKSGGSPWPDYGLASIIVHRGNDAYYVLLDWWVNECMLQHNVWISELDSPEDFRDMSAMGVYACTWEMHILNFERDAWVKHVLSREDGPYVEGYLAAQLSTVI